MMAARSQLPGMQRLLWRRNPALRAGMQAGAYLSVTFMTWLLLANHVNRLEPYAGVRNSVAGAAMIFLFAIPVLRFRQEPAKMFLSGLTAWIILSFTYLALELHYSLLASRMGGAQLFVLGGVSYAFIAVLNWVFLMCAEARQRHIAQLHQMDANVNRLRTR